jgi:formamidopyrimidine-DNA glycosylase
MPELPEVETIVRELNATLPGRVVRDVEVFRKNALGKVKPAAFRSALAGRRFGPIGRKGKFLLFQLDPASHMIAHLRMTGKFILSPPLPKPEPHHRVWFHLKDGELLIFQDMRCFGTLEIVNQLEDSPSLQKLGQDPYAPGFTAKWMESQLREGRTPLKHWLMDQSHIAGLGNIYASEAMFGAEIHPERLASSLSPAEAHRLWKVIRAVLAQAIRKNGTTISDFRRVDEKFGEFQKYLKVYGREGEPCPECGTDVVRIRQQQRSTFYCPECQQ